MKWFRRSLTFGRKERRLCKKRRAKIASVLPLVAATVLCGGAACLMSVPGPVLAGQSQTGTVSETTTTGSSPGSASPSMGVLSAGQEQAGYPPSASTGVRLVTLAWGAGQGQVGLAASSEGLQRGPEGLAVARDGRVAILDSVNHRVLTLGPSGAILGTIPVPLSEPRFLAVTDSRMYVLDADADHRLIGFDWAGADIGTLDVAAFDDPVTALFAVDDGVCIEVGHADVQLIESSQFVSGDVPSVATSAGPPDGAEQLQGQATTAGGRAAARPGKKAMPRHIAGRPLSRDLTRLAAGAFKPGSPPVVKVSRAERAGVNATPFRALTVKTPAWAKLDCLLSLDAVNSDTIIVGAHLVSQRAKSAANNKSRAGQTNAGFEGASGNDPAIPEDETPEILISRMSADGQPLGTLVLGDSPFAYVGNPYVVAPDGRIYQPVAKADGYAIFVHDFEPAAQTPSPTAEGAETTSSTAFHNVGSTTEVTEP
jgi:hypothetical protein